MEKSAVQPSLATDSRASRWNTFRTCIKNTTSSDWHLQVDALKSKTQFSTVQKAHFDGAEISKGQQRQSVRVVLARQNR